METGLSAVVLYCNTYNGIWVYTQPCYKKSGSPDSNDALAPKVWYVAQTIDGREGCKGYKW